MPPQAVTTVSPSSSEGSLDKENNNLPDLLERRTKEIEAAKNLIKQMQGDRTLDKATIASLREELESVSKSFNASLDRAKAEARAELEETKNRLAQLEDEKETLSLSLKEKDRVHAEHLDRIQSELAEKNEALLALEAGHGRQLESLREDLRAELETIKKNHLAEIATVREGMNNMSSERDLLAATVARLEQELEKSAQNLEVVTLQRVADETRFKDELSRLISSHSNELKQTEAEFAKQFSAARSQLDAKTQEVDALSKSLNTAKQHEMDLKKDFETKRSELDKRIRSAETNQVKAEDALETVRTQLSKRECEVKLLEEQIETLEHDKAVLNESLNSTVAAKASVEKNATETQERYKQVTHKLSSLEKQFVVSEEKVNELKKQVNDKTEIVKQFTNDLAALRRASDDKVRNVAIIAAVIAFVIARILAAL